MRFLDLFIEGVAPSLPREASESSNDALSVRWTLAISVVVSTAIGWGLFLAALLYFFSDESIETWLLMALGIATGHVLLGLACWRYARSIGY